MTTPPGNPLPGWYPDPAGGPGHRYWDGMNWSTVAPPGVGNPPTGVPVGSMPPAAVAPAKKGMSTGKKVAIGVGGAFVALAAIGSIGDSEDKSKSSSSSSGGSVSSPTFTQAAPAAPPAPAAPKTKEAAAAGSAVRDGKFEFQVVSVGRSATKDGIFSPEAAKGEFYSVTLRVTNVGDKAQTFFGSNQKLIIDGKKYDSSDSLADEHWMEDLNPGLSIDATVMFDIPATAVPTAIEVHDSAFSGGALVALPGSS